MHPLSYNNNDMSQVKSYPQPCLSNIFDFSKTEGILLNIKRKEVWRKAIFLEDETLEYQVLLQLPQPLRNLKIRSPTQCGKSFLREQSLLEQFPQNERNSEKRRYSFWKYPKYGRSPNWWRGHCPYGLGASECEWERLDKNRNPISSIHDVQKKYKKRRTYMIPLIANTPNCQIGKTKTKTQPNNSDVIPLIAKSGKEKKKRNQIILTWKSKKQKQKKRNHRLAIRGIM